MKKFFQNLIHKIIGIEISEQRAKDLGRVLGLVFLFITYGIGFFWGKPDNDPFNVGNVYEALHPLKVHDIIGCIIFTAGVCWITGIIEMIIGEIYTPVGSTWPNWAGFGAMLLGMLIIYL